MNFTLDEIKEYEEDDELTKTKLFGSPIFPKRFIKKRNLKIFFFLLKFILNKFKNKLTLPNEGIIYIFMDPYNNNALKILYTQEVIAECVDYIDEPYSDLGLFNAIYIKTGNDHALIKQEDDEVILLKLNLDKMPDGYLKFLDKYHSLTIKIPYEDLSICQFDFANLILE